MARILSLDFLAIFKVFGLDAAAAADAGTIWESGQAPPLTPRDGISRKGKPLAPMFSKARVCVCVFLVCFEAFDLSVTDDGCPW